MTRTGKVRPRDIKQSKDIANLTRVIKDVLFQASRSFPEGKPGTLKKEWAEITTKMVIEVVKRRLCHPGKMVARSKRKVAEYLDEQRLWDLLETKFPPLADPGSPAAQDEHVEGEQSDVEPASEPHK